jgi:hypothetical protein
MSNIPRERPAGFARRGSARDGPANILHDYRTPIDHQEWFTQAFNAWPKRCSRPQVEDDDMIFGMVYHFRPILADSTVITAVNNGEIKPADFVWAARACALSPAGRKKLIAAFERRLATEITHPVFGYRLSYRRLLEVQARLLGRHLMGEIPALPMVEPR